MNHIQETIETLRAARRRCDDTIVFLEQFQSGVDGVTHPPLTEPDGQGLEEASLPGRFAHPEKLSPKGMATLKRLFKPPAPRGTAKEGKRGEIGPRLLAATARLAEPFKSTDLAQVAQVDTKCADKFLRQRAARQQFTLMGKAQYRRGPKFPYVTHGVQDFIVGQGRPRPAAGETKAPTPVSSAPAGSLSVPTIDKPNTVTGAMKFLLRDEPDAFTREDLEDTLNADKDWKALLETETGQLSLVQALNRWVFEGYLSRTYLSRTAATFKVTAKGKEWFNK